MRENPKRTTNSGNRHDRSSGLISPPPARQHTRVLPVFDVGANPHFAQVTLAAMDAQLSKPEGSYTPTNADALDSHLRTQLGDKADATLQGALATFEKMTPDAQAWLQNSLSRLDTSTASWVVGRLASVNRANGA
jgi:hypothetical protein